MAVTSEYYGAFQDVDGISDHHKIWIVQRTVKAESDKTVTVVGYIGEGTSREIVSNWDAPFADTSLESKYRLAAGLAQVASGGTSQSKLTSRQVWVGNQPYTFNLVLKFRAIADFSKDPNKKGIHVEKAIQALELMAAPDLSTAITPGLINSRIPGSVDITVGREIMLTECCIKSISTPFDKERDRSGCLMRADVSLQIETLNALTRTDLELGFA